MWYTIKNQEVLLRIMAKPKAKKTGLVAITENGLHISIHASPHEGEANKELIRFLAELFHVPKSQVILQRGDKSKMKQVMMPLTKDFQERLNSLCIGICARN